MILNSKNGIMRGTFFPSKNIEYKPFGGVKTLRIMGNKNFKIAVNYLKIYYKPITYFESQN